MTAHALSDGELVGQLHTSSVRCGPPAVTPGTARNCRLTPHGQTSIGRPARSVSAPWIWHCYTRSADLSGGQPYDIDEAHPTDEAHQQEAKMRHPRHGQCCEHWWDLLVGFTLVRLHGRGLQPPLRIDPG
jgi:hypothetical protein